MLVLIKRLKIAILQENQLLMLLRLLILTYYKFIFKDNSGDSAKLAKETFPVVSLATKDATIAGGIVLRAIAKGDKFAAKENEEKAAYAVNGAATSAVGKTLSTLIIAIKNTVDSELKTINAVLATVTQ
ncbi:variable large family protein (plasmid) [Borrelia parkeri]|nr:variable large family protein [Borrelia parkeri]